MVHVLLWLLWFTILWWFMTSVSQQIRRATERRAREEFRTLLFNRLRELGSHDDSNAVSRAAAQGTIIDIIRLLHSGKRSER